MPPPGITMIRSAPMEVNSEMTGNPFIAEVCPPLVRTLEKPSSIMSASDVLRFKETSMAL